MSKLPQKSHRGWAPQEVGGLQAFQNRELWGQWPGGPWPQARPLPRPRVGQLLTDHCPGPISVLDSSLCHLVSTKDKGPHHTGCHSSRPTAKRAKEAVQRRAVGMPSPTWGCHRKMPLTAELGARRRAGEAPEYFCQTSFLCNISEKKHEIKYTYLHDFRGWFLVVA